MLPKIPLAEWQHIFIDTSIFIDYFSNPMRHEKDILVKERIELTQKVMNTLAEIELSDNKKRSIYVSVVTIGELRKLPNLDIDNIEIIVDTLKNHDVVFIDYSKRIASDLHKNLDKYLPNGKKYQFLAHLEKQLKQDGVSSARQWLEDDMKIAACAKSIKKLDVILTSDKRTFQPIAELMELPCLTMYVENFPKDLFGDIDFRGSQSFGKKR